MESSFLSPRAMNRRHLIAGLAGSVASMSLSGSPAFARQEPVEPTPVAVEGDLEITRNVVYREVDGQALLLDVYAPPRTSRPRAAVLYIHGGGWRHGSKDGEKPFMVCTDLVERGFVAVAIEYRLAPEFIFPAAIEDVEAAVRWLRDPSVAERFAIDPPRIGAIGSSAGGNLAGLLGSRGSGPLDAGARVRAVVSFSGPMILTTDALGFAGAELQDADVVLEYLGCAELDHCPSARAASPVTWVDATDPPCLIVNSESENRVKPEQAGVMADALRQAGVECEVIIRPGREHGIAMWSDRAIRDAALDFLQRHLDVQPATPQA